MKQETMFILSKQIIYFKHLAAHSVITSIYVCNWLQSTLNYSSQTHDRGGLQIFQLVNH